MFMLLSGCLTGKHDCYYKTEEHVRILVDGGATPMPVPKVLEVLWTNTLKCHNQVEISNCPLWFETQNSRLVVLCMIKYIGIQ
jgi:hypothetical protein